jgi:DNA polymerase alpha subunit A
MDWSSYVDNGDSNEEDVVMEGGMDNLPPLPEESNDRGVLPRVIKTLVDRRRTVKGMLKNERNEEKKQEVSF